MLSVSDLDRYYSIGDFELYPKQKEVVTFLVQNNYGLLIGKPGVGKTAMSLYTLKVWFALNAYQKVLVITKTEVISKFKAEVIKHIGLAEDEIGLFDDKSRDFFGDKSKKVYICDYFQIKLAYKYLREQRGLSTKKTHDLFKLDKSWVLILDEIQTVKNHTSDIHKLVYTNTKSVGAVLGCSGTPFEKIENLYSIFRIVNASVLGQNPISFMQGIAELYPGTLRIVYYRKDGVERAWNKVKPYLIQLTKEDIKETVKKEIIDVEIEMDQVTKIQYESQIRVFQKHYRQLQYINPNSLALLIDPLFQFIKRVNEANPRFVKFDSMVKRLVPREKLIVWDESPNIIKDLADYYNNKGIRSVYICGDVKKSSREGIIKEFNENPDIRLFFVSYLTNSDAWEIPSRRDVKRMIYYSLPDSAIKFEQSCDRLHRINSEEPVTIYRLILLGSIDLWARELLDFKMKMLDGMMNTSDFEAVEQESFQKYLGVHKKGKPLRMF